MTTEQRECASCGEPLDRADQGDVCISCAEVGRVTDRIATALRSRFVIDENAPLDDEGGQGFLFTDLAEGESYELRIRKFDPQTWGSQS
jgi:hypothetical protein